MLTLTNTCGWREHGGHECSAPRTTDVIYRSGRGARLCLAHAREDVKDGIAVYALVGRP